MSVFVLHFWCGLLLHDEAADIVVNLLHQFVELPNLEYLSLRKEGNILIEQVLDSPLNDRLVIVNHYGLIDLCRFSHLC